MKNEIVLIFGSFNPPTKAHVMMSETLHRVVPEAEICYVIANEEYISSWKGQEKILPMNTRGKLLLDAINGKYASISLIEGSNVVDGKAYNTINHFKKKYEKVYVCLGVDNLIDFHKWYKYESLLSENEFLIMFRGDVKIPEKYRYLKNMRFINFDCGDISSTKVREHYRKDSLVSIREDVPENVYEFLKETKGVF